MRNELRALGPLAICLMAGHAVAQTVPQTVSLCDLQTKTAQGERRTVRVEGVFLAGLESDDLIDPACPGQSTAVEFALTSHSLWKTLRRLSDASGRACVVFEGDFYGPRVPDARLPEGIRNTYHPGWDYNSMTKLVVHVIRSARPARADHPKETAQRCGAGARDGRTQ
jgi:hypothetical protein